MMYDGMNYDNVYIDSISEYIMLLIGRMIMGVEDSIHNKGYHNTTQHNTKTAK